MVQQREGESGCDVGRRERESGRWCNSEWRAERERALSRREWRKKKMMKINKGRCSLRTKEKKIRLEAEAYTKVEQEEQGEKKKEMVLGDVVGREEKTRKK